VVDAAMDLRARLGTGERGEGSGNERRETLLCEVGMRGSGIRILDSLTPANDRHKNPRPTLAVRPGISCSTKGCGSLVIVGSLANRNDRSVLFRHHVISIDLAPLISRWRRLSILESSSR
jgi:hypothetical protein